MDEAVPSVPPVKVLSSDDNRLWVETSIVTPAPASPLPKELPARPPPSAGAPSGAIADLPPSASWSPGRAPPLSCGRGRRILVAAEAEQVRQARRMIVHMRDLVHRRAGVSVTGGRHRRWRLLGAADRRIVDLQTVGALHELELAGVIVDEIEADRAAALLVDGQRRQIGVAVVTGVEAGFLHARKEELVRVAPARIRTVKAGNLPGEIRRVAENELAVAPFAVVERDVDVGRRIEFQRA